MLQFNSPLVLAIGLLRSTTFHQVYWYNWIKCIHRVCSRSAVEQLTITIRYGIYYGNRCEFNKATLLINDLILFTTYCFLICVSNIFVYDTSTETSTGRGAFVFVSTLRVHSVHHSSLDFRSCPPAKMSHWFLINQTFTFSFNSSMSHDRKTLQYVTFRN